MTLIERAQENVDEKQAEQIAEKLRKNTFTLDDFLSQMQQLKRMGPLGGLLELIPGMGGMAKDAQAAVDSGQLKRVEAIIQSMTKVERRDPAVLNASRRRRIARGSGTSLQDVNRLIKQFGEMQKLMRQMTSGGKRGLSGMLPFGR
jgi:signal recognition particle subunit SRP54